MNRFKAWSANGLAGSGIVVDEQRHSPYPVELTI